MNRILRGVVVLVASGLALGCNTEPDEIIGGEPTSIIADPAVVFITQGDSQAVLVRLIDQQGTSLDGPITVSGAAGPVSISIDSLFRPLVADDGTLLANTQNTELRFIVRGDALGAQALTITAEGITQALPVTVLPVALEAVLSNATPDVGELVTITAPTGFTFTDSSAITYAAGEPAQIVSVTPTTISFFPVPGSSGTLTLTNVKPDYAPGLSLPFPASTTTALTNVSLLSSDDPNAAPAINAPALGDTLVLNDNSYAVDQFYHFVITDPNTILDITFDWGETADIDFWLCDAGCTNPGNPGGFGAATGAHPEHLAPLFAAPGTYSLQANLYSGTAPSFYRLTVTRTQ